MYKVPEDLLRQIKQSLLELTTLDDDSENPIINDAQKLIILLEDEYYI